MVHHTMLHSTSAERHKRKPYRMVIKSEWKKTCNIPGLSQDLVRLAVKLDGVTWWKGIMTCHEFMNNSCWENTEFGIENRQNHMVFKDIPVNTLYERRWALAKAKTWGNHKPMYWIENRQNMKGGCSYLFTWLKDH